MIVFECSSSIDRGDGGEIQLRAAKAVLHALGMPSSWSKIRGQSRSRLPDSVPIRAIRHAMVQQLTPGTVHFGMRIVHMQGQTHLCHTATTSTVEDMEHARHVDTGGAAVGAFDVIVDASGLGSSLTRTCGVHHGAPRWVQLADAHAAIGDARQARRPVGLSRFLQSAWRLRYGGDDALHDGMQLGRRLGEMYRRLGDCSCRCPNPVHCEHACLPVQHLEHWIGEYASRGARRALKPTEPRWLLLGFAVLLLLLLLLGGVFAGQGAGVDATVAISDSVIDTISSLQ